MAALPCITYRPLGVLQCAAGGDNTVIAEHVPTLVRKDNLSLLGDYCGEQRVKFTCVALERKVTVQQSPPLAAAAVAGGGGGESSGGKGKAAAAVRCWPGRKEAPLGFVVGFGTAVVLLVLLLAFLGNFNWRRFHDVPS